MATTTQFRQVVSKVWNKEIDYNSDTIYAALMGVGYTPNLDTHAYWSDVVASEIANGGGYTTNGVLLTGCTITYTAANSWATVWTLSTVYAKDFVVRPTAGNGFLYRARVAGTASATQPTWPTTPGAEVVDGGVTWECVGAGVTVLTSVNPAWSGTITARYCVIYDRTPGTDATRPLIAVIDQGAAVTSTAGPFTVTVDAQGLVMIFPYQ